MEHVDQEQRRSKFVECILGDSMLDYAALLIAFLISTVSAYYSISGLTAIFAGAVVPIIVMGTALEVGKVVTTVWLRKNW